ncbi:MAG TPA: cytochrome c [Xanthobacteraceae bacterium]|nr:cytochrome c [Xanthobacteraceae bacterium]
MSPTGKRIVGICTFLLALGAFAGLDTRPISAAEKSTVTASGVTLHSVSTKFPDPGRLFPGGSSADAINNNCLACHSTGMVFTQPKMSRAEWQAEVNKMRNTYKAPVADADVPAIVDYLANLTVGK